MYIDHVGINTNDMEATLQFYCGILGMRLVRTTRTPDGRRHYNVEIVAAMPSRWCRAPDGGRAPTCESPGTTGGHA